MNLIEHHFGSFIRAVDGQLAGLGEIVHRHLLVRGKDGNMPLDELGDLIWILLRQSSLFQISYRASRLYPSIQLRLIKSIP